MTNNKKTKPYLSIIMTCRNDDYQKGGFKRFQMAVDTFIVQAKRYNLGVELIVVEWNPSSDKPLLKDVLSLPDDLGPLTIRFIVVPLSIHKKYEFSNKINIIYPAALNVGIRRAKGEFILTTNSDIFLSNELMHFLSLEKLEKDRFYRTFRYDVHRDVLKCASLEEQLDFSKKNIVQAFRETEVPSHRFSEHPVLQTACGADFIVFPKEYWYLLHGYPELNNLNIAADCLLCYMVYLAGLKEEILDDPMRLYHIDHDSRWRKFSNNRAYSFVKNRISNRLDYNNKWRVLLRRVYVFKDKLVNFFINIFYYLFGSFLRRISPAGNWDFNIRYWTFQYHFLLNQMLKGKRSYIYNDDNWGLPNEDFREFVISSDTKK